MKEKRKRTRPLRTVLSLVLTLGLLLSTAAYAAEGTIRYQDGQWQGTGGGRNGDVTVQVLIRDGTITEVKEVSQVEDASYWEKAKALFPTIVEQQTWKVDDVAGATLSSRGIRQAVMLALDKSAKAASENEPYSGGSGTAEDPYLISNARQLARLAEAVDGGETFADRYLALTDDIDLTSVENWNPIGGEGKDAANLFRGSFDGRGKAVSGLTIAGDYTAEANLGLFSTLGAGAAVRDVDLTGVSITASGSDVLRAGAVAGDMVKGTDLLPCIDGCTAVGAVSVNVSGAKMAFAGGIAGRMQSDAAILNCWSDVNTSAVAGGTPSAYAGGIVGTTGNNSLLLNNASFGDSRACAPLNGNFGGMAGGITAMLAGKLWNNYATGNVAVGSAGSPHSWVGALAGEATTSGMVKEGSSYVYPETGALREFGYYPDDAALTKEIWSDAAAKSGESKVEPQGVGTGSVTHDTLFTGTPMGREDMSGQTFADTLNGNLKSVNNLLGAYGISGLALNKWVVTDGRVLPAGDRWSDPTPDDRLFGGGTGTAEDPWLILTPDQLRAFAGSLTEGVDYHNYHVKLAADVDVSGSEWIPIGGSDYAFDGTFDGAGFTISGVTVGSDSEARALTKEEPYLGLFGVLNENAVIKNLNVANMRVNVYRDNYGDSLHVGGMAGAMQGATIDNCSVQGTLTAVAGGQNTFVAGLVGMQYKGAIINSHTNTDLSCTVEKGNAIAEAGGLVGLNNRGLVANCYTLGDVYGSASRNDGDEGMASISALIGVNAGSLVNCYSAGNHAAGEYSHYVGAVSGWVTGIGKSYNCWYNGEATMTIEGRAVNPVESIGTKVPSGVSDEGDVYTGGVVDKLTSYTAATYTAIAEGLNASFAAFPIDISRFGLAADALRTWTVKDGQVVLSKTPAAVTYQQPQAEIVPVVPQVMRDGVWYGRDEKKQSVVAVTVKNNKVTKTETVSGETSGEAFEAASARAQEKAVYGDTSNYEAIDPSRFAGGSGTAKDPYLISNETQLRYLAEGLNEDVSFKGLYFRQTADIQLKNGDWLPIGWGIMAEIRNVGTQYCLYPFLGSFDGDGHSISGLTIGSAGKASEDPRASYVAGLFGVVAGEHNSNEAIAQGVRIVELKNIDLIGASIHVSSRYQNFAAALVGNAQNGFVIDNCRVSGAVTSYSADSHARAGGLAGNAIRGVVTNTGTQVDVSGDTDAGNAYVGGFYAMDNRVTTVNCCANGDVTGNAGNNNKTHVGGFSGQAGGARYNCYASGNVVSKKTTGDLGGLNGRLAGIAVDNHCYFNTDAKQENAGTALETRVASGVVVPEVAGANLTEGRTAAELGGTEFVALLNENRVNAAKGMADVKAIVDACSMPYALHYTGDGSDLKEWTLAGGLPGFVPEQPPVQPVVKKAQTIKVKKTKLRKTAGDKAFRLGATITGDGTMTYKSSNTKVAAVSGKGKVTVKASGVATITIGAKATARYRKAKNVTVTITVAPRAMKLSSVKAGKKHTAVVKWKADKTVTRYQVQYSLKKNFKGAKTVKVKKAAAKSVTLKKLKKGKKYYVRIRAYQKSGRTYSKWSKALNVKAK